MARMSVKAKRNGRRWIRLYHVSPSQNDKSIEDLGLDAECSMTARKEIWACVLSKVGWAVQHVVARHDLPEGSVTIWTFKKRARNLRRRARGVYTTIRSECIPVEKIK